MKYFLHGILSVALFGSVLGGPAFGQSRVGTVDLAKVFDGYYRTKQAQDEIDVRKADLTREGKGLLDDLKTANDGYQKLVAEASDQTLSLEKRDERKKAAETKLRDIESKRDTVDQFRRTADATLQELSRQNFERILGEIRTTVIAKAKAGGFALVVDASAVSGKGTPVVLFDSGANDLTSTVLSQLNAGAPLETPKSADRKEEKK